MVRWEQSRRSVHCSQSLAATEVLLHENMLSGSPTDKIVFFLYVPFFGSTLVKGFTSSCVEVVGSFDLSDFLCILIRQPAGERLELVSLVLSVARFAEELLSGDGTKDTTYRVDKHRGRRARRGLGHFLDRKYGVF